MSVEVTLICDGCGKVIDGGRTAKKIRDEARGYGARVSMPGGKDYCPSCVAAGHTNGSGA
jgi:hypothetical protein